MKRFLTSLAVLAVFALLSCEKHESPVAPPQDQQNSAATNPEAQKFAQDLEAWQAKMNEHLAALNIQAEKHRQNQLSKKGGSSKITVPDDYPTIQQAVDAAAPGTKILVKDGIYVEDVYMTTDNLTLTAAHAGQTQIDGGINLNGVTKGKIEGFVIRGVSGFPPSAIQGVFLINCTKVEFKENEVSFGYGLVLNNSVGCVVKDNDIHDVNQSPGPGIALYLQSGRENLIKGNFIHNNFLGLNADGSTKNAISSNQITDNRDTAIRLNLSYENDLGDNECSNNRNYGLFVINSEHNKIGSDNAFNNNVIAGIWLYSGANNNLFKKNEALGNGHCDVIDQGTGNTFTGNHFGSFNCP